jgi:hypothetical protein
MKPWEQPVEVRIAAAQAHLLARVRQAQHWTDREPRVSDPVEVAVEPER